MLVYRLIMSFFQIPISFFIFSAITGKFRGWLDIGRTVHLFLTIGLSCLLLTGITVFIIYNRSAILNKKNILNFVFWIIVWVLSVLSFSVLNWPFMPIVAIHALSYYLFFLMTEDCKIFFFD